MISGVISRSGAYYFGRNVDFAMIKEDLQSQETSRQLDALRQVLSFMTVGRDMSPHFLEIVNLASSSNMQLKKLVYAYLVQTARSQPEKAVLQAGTFAADTSSPSPLIRGMALRTMSSMEVPAMADFLLNPILRGLRDADPYVRRTAVLASLKFYLLAPAAFRDGGVQDTLLEVLQDPVASIVATVVSVLYELIFSVAKPITSLGPVLLQKRTTLLAALADCSEWQQHYLLEGIAFAFQKGNPSAAGITADEAVAMATRVAPLLSAANSAVAMSAAKVVILFVEHIGSLPLPPLRKAQLENQFAGRVVSPLLSLLSNTRHEIRYAVLRNIRLLLAASLNRFHIPFADQLSVFFVKYNEPLFIKLEKVDIMITLATTQNAPVVLSELMEYASEVDVEFVRRAVKSIGLLAIKLESVADLCVAKLEGLIHGGVHYVVQEAAVVVQLILRQYGAKYDSVIPKLCAAFDCVDDPASKAAVAWVIGEFSERVVNADQLLTLFFSSFDEEPLEVQLSVLNAVVKAYVKSCQHSSVELQAKMRAVLEKLLGMGTASVNPDLRDRSFFYWRLVGSGDAREVQAVVLSQQRRAAAGAATAGGAVQLAGLNPSSDGTLSAALNMELLQEFGCVSSVVGKPVRLLLGDPSKGSLGRDAQMAVDEVDAPGTAAVSSSSTAAAVHKDVLQEEAPAPRPAAAAAAGPSSAMQVVLPRQSGNGVEISMCWAPSSTNVPLAVLQFQLEPPRGRSNAVTSVRVTTLQLNVNLFGLGFAQEVAETTVRADAPPVTISLLVNCNNGKKPVKDVQVAVKMDPIGVFFFSAPPIPPGLLLLPSTGCDPNYYITHFQSLTPSWSMLTPTSFPKKVVTSAAKITANALRMHSITLVHSKVMAGGGEGGDGSAAPSSSTAAMIGLHLFLETIARHKLFIDVKIEKGTEVTAVNVRSTEPEIASLFGEYILTVLDASSTLV